MATKRVQDNILESYH